MYPAVLILFVFDLTLAYWLCALFSFFASNIHCDVFLPIFGTICKDIEMSCRMSARDETTFEHNNNSKDLLYMEYGLNIEMNVTNC